MEVEENLLTKPSNNIDQHKVTKVLLVDLTDRLGDVSFIAIWRWKVILLLQHLCTYRERWCLQKRPWVIHKQFSQDWLHSQRTPVWARLPVHYHCTVIEYTDGHLSRFPKAYAGSIENNTFCINLFVGILTWSFWMAWNKSGVLSEWATYFLFLLLTARRSEFGAPAWSAQTLLTAC